MKRVKKDGTELFLEALIGFCVFGRSGLIFLGFGCGYGCGFGCGFVSTVDSRTVFLMGVVSAFGVV